MTQTLITEETLPGALQELAALDADFARALEEAGPPPLRQRPSDFSALLRIIVAQQVSLASAQAIWNRLEAACQPLAPETMLSLDDDALRGAGLSRQKMSYSRSLAGLLASGELDLAAVARLDDEAAIAEITKVKGLGRWSAECFLLFSLGRPDVWPIDDVGIMIGAQRLKGLKKRPDAKKLARMGKAWRPWRAVAARMLWHYRGSTGIPDAEA